MTANNSPIRRHSRPKGRCEVSFWKAFNPKDFARYMKAAERFERTQRKPGERSGPLGPVGLEVLRELLRMIDYRTGRLDPSITTLMTRLNRSRDAIVRALTNLRRAGFLDWLRRWEATGKAVGQLVKQATNAYRLFLPAAAERLLDPPSPLPDDFIHARAAKAAAIRGMIDALPLSEQGSAEFGTSDRLGATFDRLGKAIMERQDRESAKRSESSNSLFSLA